MKTNYHIHTHYCHHAFGKIEDFVLEAINKGFDEIGFSDHAYITDALSFTISKTDMNNYYNDIMTLKKKYKNKISILCGLEVDYIEGFEPYYKRLKSKYDFLGLSVHFFDYTNDNIKKSGAAMADTKEDIDKIVNSLINGMNTKLFSFVCHPDNFIFNREWNQIYYEASESIIKSAIENNCLLEVNANGIRKPSFINKNGAVRYIYPREEFFEIAKKYNAKVIINTDAHIKEHIEDYAYYEAIKFTSKLKLNVIEKL